MKYLRLSLLGLLALGVLAVWATGSSSASDWYGVKLVGGPAATAQLALADPLDGGCKVGSLRSDRVATGSLFEFATGTAYDDARAELADPANFGPSGIVDQGFELLPAVFDITGSSLADVDIFWAALLLNTVPLSSVEQQMLLDFVEAGRALVVIADVGPNFSTGPNSVAAPFGVRWDDTSFIDAEPTITDASHPIIDGPFGTVASIAHASEGSIEDLGAHALEIASNLNGSSIAHVPPAALGPGSGPVVFFSDVNEFTSNDAPGGPGFDRGNNRVLFKNLFAFLSEVCAEPEPLPTPALFLIIDEDAIDNGTSTVQAISDGGAPFCGGPAGGPGNSGVCVNEDIASDGAGRDPACDPNNPMVLFSRPGPPPSISGLRLPTGQFGDEGLFSLINPNAAFLNDYLDGCDLDLLPADPVFGFQGQLDPVAGFPLRNLQIEALEGRTVCAVVHDSNVNVEGNQLDLGGNRLGLTAFDVTDVLPPGGLPESGSSSSLPVIEVDIINDPDQVLAICEGPLEFLPEPPPDVDNDGDGFDDNVEVAAGTNPVRPCADSSVLPPLIDPNPADVDNDTIVDITDIVAFAARFGQTGPPRYDVAPGSPAGPDGFVDITDIVAVAVLFGQRCE